MSADRIPETADLPPVTVEQVLIKWSVEAYAATAHLPRKMRGGAFLRKSLEIGRKEAALTRMSPARPASEHAAVSRCRRQALAILEEYVPALLETRPEG